MGYRLLRERHALVCLPHDVESFVLAQGVRRTEVAPDGRRAEYYIKQYWPGDSDFDHLEFALRYEGLHLGLLRALLPRLDPVATAAYVREKPTGAYAQRADLPDRMHDGRDLIVPLRVATDFAVAKEDSNPIGFAVHGADGLRGGTVRDIWVDRGESMARYYEVEVAGGKHVLLPVPFSLVSASAKRINVQAILGGQFINVPATKSLDRVTMLEEEKVVAYYGAGTLYATPERSEPLI